MSKENLDPAEHPALKHYSKPLEMIKHVAEKAIKWAAIGALAGAAAFAIVPTAVLGTIGSVLATAVGVVSSGGAGAIIGGVGSSIGAAAVAGMGIGAVAGAITGGLIGVTGASAAAEDARQDKIEDYDSRVAYELRAKYQATQVENQRVAAAQQARGQGLMPNLPMGLGGADGRERV